MFLQFNLDKKFDIFVNQINLCPIIKHHYESDA
jgi:hypothetical protein